MKESETAHRASIVASAAAPPLQEMEEDEKEGEQEEDDMIAAMEAAATAAAAVENVVATGGAGFHSVNDDCFNELKRYMIAPPLTMRSRDDDGNYVFHDPLVWWKQNQMSYPILARLAMIYLAVQATSAPSERVFSLASRIITNKRNRLNPDMAGKMLFVSENWKWWQEQLNFYELAGEEGE
jgi:hypothetical protein